MKEKDLLLNSLDDIRTSENLSSKHLFIVLMFMSIVILLLGPKVYLANNIYYDSIKFNKEYGEHNILKEEHEALKQKLEKIRFERLSSSIDF